MFTVRLLLSCIAEFTGSFEYPGNVLELGTLF